MQDEAPKPPTAPTKRKSIPFPKSVEMGKSELDSLMESLPAKHRERVEAVVARNHRRSHGIAMQLKLDGGKLEVKYTHNSPEAAVLILMADLATMDPAFYMGVSGQVARIGSKGATIDEDNSNFLLSVVRAVQPRDELETLLAVQMGAIHSATMNMARRLNHVETIPQQDAAERALNKLARTYAMQMEALKRYRTGGQQRVIVEHVTVNAGGQAIVGAVAAGGGGHDER